MCILLKLSISFFVPMKETSESIFDEQFLAAISIRRLNIMPLMLKLYVGFYTVSGAVALYRMLVFLFRLIDYEGVIDSIGVSVVLGRYAFSVLRGMATLSLWMEKKWAVQAALIISILSVVSLLLLYVPVILTDGLVGEFPSDLFYVALEIPYIFLLATIRRDWKHRALSGKEIAVRKAQAAGSGEH
jgi:hypothetical protein